MASQYYIVIKLDPHYQRFLRSHFTCESEIFEFPARHRFNTMLEHFVSTKPHGYIDPEGDGGLFKIALPNFEYKNPAHFRYLSKVKEMVFKAKIKEYYDWIIQERIGKLMKRAEKREDGNMITLDRQQCTIVLIDEFGFDSDDRDSFDRLYKLFTRYKKKEINRRFVVKKKNENINC
ncbi:MAG TPA: hypothetical protein VFC67_16970 [Prolixibacteraceae bacterium]|nr:hypothetical protein [Prolixibacteraceae bacterium]